MEKLTDVSTAELEAELQRRNSITPIAEPDFTKLRDTVIRGIELAVKENYLDEDLRGYVWEAAVEAVYGKGFFEWRKRQSW